MPPEPAPAFLLARAGTVIPAEDLVSRFNLDARPTVMGAPDCAPSGNISDVIYIDEWGVTRTISHVSEQVKWERVGKVHSRLFLECRRLAPRDVIMLA